MNLTKLKDSLRLHEGERRYPYEDSEGLLTIGIGRNLDSKGLKPSEIEFLLENDIHDAIADLDRDHHGWRAHSSNRQNVLVEVMFNLGAPRFALFVRMWEALEQRNYPRAAAELLDSHWAEQVGQRAKTLAEQMRRG